MSTNPSDVLKNKAGKVAIAKKVGIRNAITEILKIIPELIKIRTESGESLNGGRFKDLELSTVLYRDLYRRNLDGRTSPDESNNIATGQMIDAITGKRKPGSAIFTINDKQRKTELFGGKSTKTNNQVREYVEKIRPFFGITEEEREDLIKICEKIIKEEIVKVFK